MASFSPKDKYLLITEYKLDAKKKNRTSYVTLVIDANKGKQLYELPAFNRKLFRRAPVPKGKPTSHNYNWVYGDDLVRVYFFSYARDGNLNLSTGIFTGSYGDSRFNLTISYTCNYADLLSSEKSPELILDDETRIMLPAQGAFLSDKYVWYLSLTDFAEAIGATVTDDNGVLTVSRNDKVMTISSFILIITEANSS